MNPRQYLRALKHAAAELIPWQLVAVTRGRDFHAELMHADIADDEFDTLEPPVGVDAAPPVAPPAGPTRHDLEWAAGVVKAFAVFNAPDDERDQLRALADRLTQ